MDPISFVGSLIQVIGCVASLVQYLNDVKHGPRDRATLAREATGLLTLLTELRYSIEDAGVTERTRLPAAQELVAPGGPLDEFQSAVTALLRKLRPKGVWRFAEWPLRQAEVERLLVRIERLKSLISLYRQEDHFRLSSRIDNSVTALKNEACGDRNTRGLLDTLKWISPLDFEKKQAYYFSRCATGTGEWFLTSDVFRDWLGDAPKTLWCRGQPGAGKTVLTSIIVNHLKQQVQTGAAVVYIYCDYKESSTQTAEALVASLVRQLVKARGDVSPALLSLKKRHEAYGSRPTLTEWEEIIRDELDCLSQVFFVIDALDECADGDGTRSRFVRTIRALKSSVHMLITSRLVSSVEAEIGEAICADIQASGIDISRYLESRIVTERRLIRLLGKDPDLRDAVLRTIAENAQGMFLLAQLQMDAVAMKNNRRDVRRALSCLPLALSDTYEEALRRIGNQGEEDVKLAKKLLSWIVCAKRPLTVLEVQHALTVEPGDADLDEEGRIDEEVLISSCAGLVTVDSKSNVVRLVHHTAQEHFEQNRLSLLPGANLTIAHTCLDYLSFAAFDMEFCSAAQLEQLLERYPLVPYAFHYWVDHLPEEPTLELDNLALAFLRARSKVALAARITSMAERGFVADFNPANQDMGLHVAARSGRAGLVRSLLATGANPDTNALDLNGDTPLTLAAALDHEAVASELLRHPATDVNARDARGWTPLIRAAISGSAAVARLLLDGEQSVDVNARDGFWAASALWWAADGGHDDVVRLLVGSGSCAAVDVSVRDDFFAQTAAERAIAHNHEGVVRLLGAFGGVDTAADAGARDNLFCSSPPTSIAAEEVKNTAQLPRAIRGLSSDAGEGALQGLQVTALHMRVAKMA